MLPQLSTPSILSFWLFNPLLLAVLPPPSLFLKGSSCEHPIAFSPEEPLLVLHKVLVLSTGSLERHGSCSLNLSAPEGVKHAGGELGRREDHGRYRMRRC